MSTAEPSTVEPETAEAEVDSDEENEVLPKDDLAEEAKTEVVEDTTLANSDVTTKYQEAAKIVQATMVEMTKLCIPGAKLLDLCLAGDAFINEKAGLIFRGKGKNGKVVEKGIAFPVCVSVNEIVCHYSPVSSEDKLPPLALGDMVKIDLGAHVDGYIAVGAHTIIVGHTPNAEAPITGPRADVILAAWTAAEVAARLIKAGGKNTEVTAAIKKVADHFGVKPLSGIQMNQMKRYVIDGKKAIQLREDDVEKVEACTFDQYEVYALDVAMSTGEGKPRPAEDQRTTVFKRQVDQKYSLKVKASRSLFNEINKRFPTMPFSIRYLEGDETSRRMGLRECVNNGLIAPYAVMAERPGDQIAHVKFTLLLLASGTVKVTGLDMPAGFVSQAERGPLPAELQALLVPDEAVLEAERRRAKKRAARKKKTCAGASTSAVAAEDKEDDEA